MQAHAFTLWVSEYIPFRLCWSLKTEHVFQSDMCVIRIDDVPADALSQRH